MITNFRMLWTWRVGRWYLARNVDQMRPQYVATVGLLVLWAALTGAIDMPLNAETRQIAGQLKQHKTHEPAKPGPTAQQPAASDLTREFISSLPELATCTVQLRALDTLADKSGVTIASVHYRYEQVPGLAITKVAIVMDVRGDDMQLRKFMQTTLNAFPNLSITHLAYTKGIDSANVVMQKFDVNLYFQARAKAPA